MPFGVLSAGENSIRLQALSNIFHASAFQIFSVNPAYNLSFFLIYDELAVFVLRVSQEVIVVDLNLSFLVAELQSQLDVLGKGRGFLLGQ